ncbi:MAG: hypothetical protein E6K81_03330, partial [Candidatus Eisenbacteria bacterium]
MPTRTHLRRARAIAIAMAAILASVLFSASAFAQSSGDYRSAASGNWNATSTWETFNGTAWVAAGSTPTSTNGVITVQSPHTVTVTGAVTVDQVVISSGGQITLASGITLTINNGTGTDLSVNGTFRNEGGTLTNSSGTIAFNAGGKYQHARDGGNIPTATWAATSTCEVLGVTAALPTATSFAQPFGNFTWNCPGQGSSATTFNLGGNLTSVAGDFTLGSTGASGILNAGSGNNFILTIGGSLVLQAGTFNWTTGGNNTQTLNLAGDWNQTGGTFQDTGPAVTVNFTGSGRSFTQSGGTLTTTNMIFAVPSGASLTLNNGLSVATTRTFTVGGTLNCGNNTVAGAGTFTLSPGGTLGIGSTVGITTSGATGNIQTTTRTFDAGATYTYNNPGAGQFTGSGLPATVTGLALNNAGGLTLSRSGITAVSTTLTFTSGKLTVGSGNTLALASANATGASTSTGWAIGAVRRTFPSGTSTRTFDIGDATRYTPVTMAMSGLSAQSDITATTSTPDHPNLGSSSLEPSKSANRWWTLTPTGSPTFTNYSATFNFDAGDLDGAAAPLNFVVGRFASSAWTVPTVGARTATSTQATGLTGFGDFAVAELLVHTITATAGANGAISPSGAVSVPHQTNQTFSITPDACNQIQDVLVDGVSVGAVSSYTFSNVTTDHTIAASFVPGNQISASAGAN